MTKTSHFLEKEGEAVLFSIRHCAKRRRPGEGASIFREKKEPLQALEKGFATRNERERIPALEAEGTISSRQKEGKGTFCREREKKRQVGGRQGEGVRVLTPEKTR